MLELPAYRYGGARALVLMHDRAMRDFLAVWHEADAAALPLPASADPNYASRAALLYHVLRAARGYLTWMCEMLGLADPGIAEVPAAEHLAQRADACLEQILERWQTPLAAVEEDACYRPEYPSRWGTLYCIDAMLEHAVMHPQRHAFQLRQLLAAAR